MADFASAAQAFAAMVALALSTWSVFEARAAAKKARDDVRADVKAQDDLRAQMMATTIVIDLQILSGDLERLSDYVERLPCLIAAARNGPSPGITLASDMASRGKIVLPKMLELNLDRLYWLGQPLGGAMLLLMSLIYGLNGLLSHMARDVIDHQGKKTNEWLDQIKPQVRLARNTLAQVHTQIQDLIGIDDDKPAKIAEIP